MMLRLAGRMRLRISRVSYAAGRFAHSREATAVPHFTMLESLMIVCYAQPHEAFRIYGHFAHFAARC